MVQQFIQWAKFSLLVSLIAFVLALCWGVYWSVLSLRSAQKTVSTSAQKINKVLDDTDVTISKISSVADNINNEIYLVSPKLNESVDNLKAATEGINLAVSEINKPCSNNNVEDCGTISYLNKAIKSTRLAVGQVTAISLREQGELHNINTQEIKIATITNNDLIKLGDSLNGLDNLLTVQLPPLTKQLTISASNLSSMTDDGKQELHKILHPSWPMKIVKGIVTVPGQVIVWLLTKI